MNDSPRILIIRLSSLGDILHTLPAFSSLRTAFPNARIDWLAAKKSAFLMPAIPGIDAVHILDTASLLRFPVDRSGWREARKLVQDLRAIRFDLVIDFQGLLKTAFLALLSKSETRVGFSAELVRERPAHWFYHKTLKKPREEVHVVLLNQMLAELAGARRTASSFEFSLPAADRDYVDAILAREHLTDFVVINPGGGWPTKRWSPEKYGRLAARIQSELGIQVTVTTGPGEEPLYKGIAESCGGPAPRHFPITFLQMIPFLKKARLFVGGDTGPFHLACTVGTPVVGVFGPTSPTRNGSWVEGDEIISHPLPCSFCYGRTCPTNNECMDITVDEVFAGVVRRLGMHEGSSVARS